MNQMLLLIVVLFFTVNKITSDKKVVPNLEELIFFTYLL